MDNLRKMLQDMVGIEGVESLNKAIYRSATQSVADPMELYLPLMVVPRTILSWLVQNIQPLKAGQYKDLELPGQPGTTLHVEKQASDVYRGEIIQSGKIIHSFEKQSLPSIGGHMMTVFEQYDHLKDPVVMDRKEAVQEHEKLVDVLKSPSHKDDKEEAKEQERELKQYKSGTEEKPSLELPKAIMSLNGIDQMSGEESKWAYSHMNVKELVGVIGKLVDALVANHKTKTDLAEAIGKEEMKGDDQKVTKTKDPSESAPSQLSSQEKAKWNKESPVQENKEGQETPHLIKPEAKRLSEDRGPIESEKYGDKVEGKIAKEGLAKEDIPEDKPKGMKITPQMYFRMSRKEKMARAHQEAHEAKHGKPDPKAAMAAAIAAIESKDKNPPAKKMDTLAAAEPLSKPYVSDAQRRWAHTTTGTKALGGKAAVHHWDEATKGKKLPERVEKDDQGVHEAPNPKKPGQSRMGYFNEKSRAAKKRAAVSLSRGPRLHAEHYRNVAREEAKRVLTEQQNLPKPELGKGGAEMPAGAGMSKKPQAAQMPTPPVPQSKNPAAAAAKQSQAAARGQQAKPPTAPKPPKGAAGAAHKAEQFATSDYFTGKLRKIRGKAEYGIGLGGGFPGGANAGSAGPALAATEKKEKSIHLTEEEIYTPCTFCGMSEFEKTESGPKFRPCYCFMVMAKNEQGKDVWFVRLSKTSDGYKANFNPQADKESIETFMTTLKAKLGR